MMVESGWVKRVKNLNVVTRILRGSEGPDIFKLVQGYCSSICSLVSVVLSLNVLWIFSRMFTIQNTSGRIVNANQHKLGPQ